ncbi:hypothetical protein ACE38V_05845 [Cytobacillus sp. Hz8]|uniref:hypothetical protein n=1 Tax=Cytobacillus sp. Hz8 TaxID=3347168 RepID=UPI0035E141A5
MYGPEKFDQNEWFAIISGLSMLILIFLLPRRLPTIVSVVVFMIGLSFSRFSDHLLGSVDPFDHYDVMDSGQFEWFDLFTYSLYGFSAYFFIYIYSWMNLKGIWAKAVYVLVWSSIGVGFEYFAVYFDFFHYIDWHYKWSFLTYLLVQPVTLILYHWVNATHFRRAVEKESEE